ncbi:hypothetical protein C3L33_07478, partial [Rhododendron williamsianum]
DGLEADVEVTTGLVPGVAVGATECTGRDAGVSAGVSAGVPAAANDDLEADKNQGEEIKILAIREGAEAAATGESGDEAGTRDRGESGDEAGTRGGGSGTATESQQPAVGVALLPALLPVMKFMHGVKLVTFAASLPLLVANGGGSSMGVTVNQTLALALPGACDVQTPSVSQCNGKLTFLILIASNSRKRSSKFSSTYPRPSKCSRGSPAESPDDSSDDTPTTGSDSDIPSEGTGSKTVPTTSVSSDRITIQSTLHIAVFLVSVISSASAATGF